CAWEKCVFHGKYEGTHFGILHDLRDSNPWGDIIVKDCDFSRAIMYFCFFQNTDVNSTIFPKWPCFTLLRPERNYAKWKATFFSIQERLMDTWFANRGEND